MIKLELITTSLGCGKCKKAIEIIEKMMQKYKGKIKMKETDIIKNPNKLMEFGVLTTPAIIINGKLAFEGTPNEKKLDKMIKEEL